MNKLVNELTLETITLVEVKKIDTFTKSFIFSKPNNLSWEAGANGHLAFLDFNKDNQIDKTLVRHMSFASLPESNHITINSRVPGSQSTYKQRLNDLKIGDEMVLFGIKNRMPLKRDNSHIVLISMGVGITSFKTFFDEYKKDTSNIQSMTSLCVDGHRTNLYKDDVSNTLDLTYCHTQKDFYSSLESMIDIDQSFYIVGSDQFLKDVIKTLRDNGVNKSKIYIDKKPNKYSVLGLL